MFYRVIIWLVFFGLVDYLTYLWTRADLNVDDRVIELFNSMTSEHGARTANAIAKVSRRFWREVEAQGDETVRLVALIKEGVLTSASAGSNEVLIPLQGKEKARLYEVIGFLESIGYTVKIEEIGSLNYLFISW